MLNAPEEVECPSCKRTFSTYFDDYDIDSPCNPEPGIWKLRTQCPHCDEEGRETSVVMDFRVQLVPTVPDGPLSAPGGPSGAVPGSERVSGSLDRPGSQEDS